MDKTRSLTIDKVTFEISNPKSSAPSFKIKMELEAGQVNPEIEDLKSLRDFLNIFIYESNIYKTLNENHREMRENRIN
jgi:hypothetical protein